MGLGHTSSRYRSVVFVAVITSALITSAPAPALAQSLPSALVWLPPENFSDWSEVDRALHEHSNLKLTVALTPAMASPLARAALGPWAAKGRVELAARIDGDPILTLVASHPAAPRPQDALERAVEAREKILKRLEWATTGLAIGAGALDAALASALGASGANWVLTGPYASGDEPWAAAGKAVLVAARSLPESADDGWAAPGAAVYDESASTASVFLATLAALSERTRPALGWTTVGELVNAKTDPRLEASAIAAWPAWDPAAAIIPPTDPAAKAAWDAYGAAAAAVDRYQNSGTAELNALDAAVKLLRRASAARHYRAAGLSPELRAQLLAVYKRLKLPAPDSLYDGSFLTTCGSCTSSPYGSVGFAGTHEEPTQVKASAGTSWLEFRGPAGTLALAPIVNGTTAAPNAFPNGGAAAEPRGWAADPWRIQSLRAQWDADAVRLTLRVGRAFAGPPRPVYEIYVDFNHVLGAGRVPLLEGRGAVVPARDAWELALSIAGEEARLYRARGGAGPEETAAFKAEWTDVQGEVKVAVPRAFMRGNPSRWGWAVVALAEDPARADRRPPAPLVGPDGAILLGVLAPIDVQTAVLTRANLRVPAARLDP